MEKRYKGPYIYFVKKDHPVTREPSCLEGMIHDYQPYNPNGEKRNFVDLCNNCGLPKIDPQGIYSNMDWQMYKTSEEYKSLFQQSLEIKRKNGMAK